jgi:hypothetical protein
METKSRRRAAAYSQGAPHGGTTLLKPRMGAKDSASCLLFCRGRRGFCGFFNWQDGVAPSRLSSIYERRSGCARGVTVGCQGGEWGRAWGGSPGARCACKERKPRLQGGACEGGPRRRVACTARGGGGGGRPKAGGERGGAEALEGGLIPYTYVQSGPGRVPGLCCLRARRVGSSPLR